MTTFCPDEEKLATWMEQKLPVAEDQTVAKHLASCDECRRAVTLAYLSRQELPPSLNLGGEAQVFQAVQTILNRPSACPSDEFLAIWLREDQPETERAAISDHLATCDDCRRAVALTRLAKEDPVAALNDIQEQRALSLVLRQTSKSIRLTFWRLAAASLLVGTATTYLAYQWNVKAPETSTAAAKPVVRDIPALNVGPNRAPVPLPKPVIEPPMATTLPEPPKPTTAPEPFDPAQGKPPPIEQPPAPAPEPKPEEKEPPKPEPGTTRAEIASRFRPVTIFEVDGKAPVSKTGALASMSQVGYGDTLHAEKAGSMNVDGRAIVSVEAETEFSLGRAITNCAFALQVESGCAYVDTTREDQQWEFWHAEKALSIDRVNGRVAVEATATSLRLLVLTGHIEMTKGSRLDVGSSIQLDADGAVTSAKGGDADLRSRKSRFDALRPKSLLVLVATGHVPWKADARSSEDPVVPDCFDPINWTGIALDRSILYSSGLKATVRYKSTGASLYFAADGYYRAVTGKVSGDWVTETWLFKGMQKEMVDLVAGEPLKKVSFGVVQAKGKGQSLEIESIEIRRSID